MGKKTGKYRGKGRSGVRGGKLDSVGEVEVGEEN